MRKISLMVAMFLLIGGNITSIQAQSEFGFNARFFGVVSPILGGNAGSSAVSDPSYDDAFDLGYGGGGELEYLFSPEVSFLLGAYYETWDGDTYQGMSFEDWEIIPIYVGAKYMLPWENPYVDLYIRGDVGAAHLSSEFVTIGGVGSKYWSSTWVFTADAGVGAEYHMDNFGVFLEVRGRYIDDPNSASAAFSRPKGSWSLPIFFGVSLRF